MHWPPSRPWRHVAGVTPSRERQGVPRARICSSPKRANLDQPVVDDRVRVQRLAGKTQRRHSVSRKHWHGSPRALVAKGSSL